MTKKQRQVTQLTSDNHTMPFSTNQGKAALIPALPRRKKAHESKKSLPLLSLSDCIRQNFKQRGTMPKFHAFKALSTFDR
jgi:hypothetical protein